MSARPSDELPGSRRSNFGRLFNPADSELPDGQTRGLVRETLWLFGWLALLGTLLTFLIGLSTSPAMSLLGVAFSMFLFLMRWLATRLSDRVMAGTFLLCTLVAAALMARSLQTIQSVHMLLLALPLIFSTFVYGPLLGLAYGAGIGLIGALLARHEVLTSSAIRFDPYSQAWLLFELLLMIFLLALGLRRYVAIAHRAASEAHARQARAEGAASIQARLEMALHAGRFGVWEFDPSRRIAVLDQWALELMGQPAQPNEVTDAQLMHRILSEDRSKILARWTKWLRDHKPAKIRFRVHNRAGELRWVSLVIGGAPSAANQPIVGVIADVTGDIFLRSRMQNALRRADQAAAAAKAYFFELDLRTGLLVRDQRAERLLGLPQEENSRTPADLFSKTPEPARSRAVMALETTLGTGGTSFDIEVPVINAGADPRFFRNLFYIERGADGTPTRIYGMDMDVTESRRVRRDLERITTRFELAAEAGGIGLWQFDLKSQLVTQTSIGVAMFDLPSDRPISVDWYSDRILLDDRTTVEAALRRAIAGKGGFEIVYRIQVRGSTRWVRSAGRLESNDRGAPVRLAGVNWDITNDVQARDQLTQINNRLGLALSAANASVWEYNSASDVDVWDERGRDLYGVDPNFFGRRIDLVYAPDRASFERQKILLRSGTLKDSFVLEYRIEHPTRGLRWLRCIGQVERSSNPNHQISVGIDIDVTAERTATDAIEKARQVAEDANRSKSSFLANMSHEIRTPMNAIIGMTELAHRASSLAQATSYAAQAHSAARGLLTVLNDVLDFSKIEAGRLDLETLSFSLEEMLGSVLDVAAFGAAEKNLDLLLDVGDTVYARYFGDPVRIGQILHNLASNAIKFTEQGSVRINVRHTATGRLRFEVIDTGCGISARQQEGIFEPFSQGDLSTSRRFGGTGLGLSISRRLAELMNAEIGVFSYGEQNGQGATFWLEIPQPKAVFDAEIGPLVWAPWLLESPEVLLAHHSQLVCQSLMQQLNRLRIKWRVLENLPALQRCLIEATPDSCPVAMIDRRLLADDPTFLSNIRGLACRPRTVLLGRMLSDMPNDETALLEPALPSELRDVLLATAGRAARSRRIYSHPQGSDAYWANRPPRDALAGVEILLVEDNDLNRSLVLAILSESGASVRIAENGIESVQAVAHRLPDVVLMDIHMPLMDGYQATAAIRALGPGGRNVPIIALTADALEGNHDKTLRAGMNDHLTKPVDSAQLMWALHRWTVGRDDFPRTRPGTVGASPSPRPVASWIDFEAGIRSFQNRQSAFMNGLQVFVSVYSNAVAPMAAGTPALPLFETAEFTRLVHNLHGGVRPMGMFPLAALAAKIYSELQLHPTPNASQQTQLLNCLQATLNEANDYLAKLQPQDISLTDHLSET